MNFDLNNYIIRICNFLYDNCYYILFTILLLAVVYPGHGLCNDNDDDSEESIYDE